MGPRRYRRGCLYLSYSVGVRCTRFNGAATLPSRMWKTNVFLPGSLLTLQWGRDVTVADVFAPPSFVLR